MPYDPTYVPSGVNNRVNPWYEGYNHTKISRLEESRGTFYTSPIGIASGGVAPTQYAYDHDDLINTHPDYATISLTSNYVSIIDGADVGIDSVVFTVDGTNQIGTFQLTEFEYVRLVVTDLDTIPNVRTWTIDASVTAFGIGGMAVASTFIVG